MRKRNDLRMKEILTEAVVKVANGRDLTSLSDAALRRVLDEVEKHPDYERITHEQTIERDRRTALLDGFAATSL
jgi:hypothetical protein